MGPALPILSKLVWSLLARLFSYMTIVSYLLLDNRPEALTTKTVCPGIRGVDSAITGERLLTCMTNTSPGESQKSYENKAGHCRAVGDSVAEGVVRNRAARVSVGIRLSRESGFWHCFHFSTSSLALVYFTSVYVLL